ncbi:hypothetical protein RJ640_023340 [Escallonia rubra]|uniref:Uncharacterized protein n=1 Tax=Escallonia rubra TaxID=112253 RepID=A0AA88R9J2_9ASTE|nr:hypothetical protein RJ640_023335 [Escallonia rubra]KAK2983220.1 hypothetical protein RJ640_023340 [Escallonia rubra]
MKYMVSERVESSKANCLFSTSSAPFTVRQEATGTTPRGREARVMVDSLNQKSLPCLSTNQRRRQVLMYSPCLVSQPNLEPEKTINFLRDFTLKKIVRQTDPLKEAQVSYVRGNRTRQGFESEV